jgi:threonine dehydratase
MPEETPSVKIEATRAHGAEVVLCGAGQRERVADDMVAQTGGVLIPPFDHPDVIAGQGTAALELMEDVPGLDALIAPVGGGGLVAGVCIAAKGLDPRVRVFAAEPRFDGEAICWHDSHVDLIQVHRCDT